MEKKQIKARQSEALEALLNRLPQKPFEFLGGRIAQIAFAGDPHAVWQASTESFADNPLRLPSP
jgi:hypothetical protein